MEGAERDVRRCKYIGCKTGKKLGPFFFSFVKCLLYDRLQARLEWCRGTQVWTGPRRVCGPTVKTGGNCLCAECLKSKVHNTVGVFNLTRGLL